MSYQKPPRRFPLQRKDRAIPPNRAARKAFHEFNVDKMFESLRYSIPSQAWMDFENILTKLGVKYPGYSSYRNAYRSATLATRLMNDLKCHGKDGGVDVRTDFFYDFGVWRLKVWITGVRPPIGAKLRERFPRLK